jgi:hypothetical protein
MSDKMSITLAVSPEIAAAWQALPPERRIAYERAIVEAWLEPLSMRPVPSAVYLPFHTLQPTVPRSTEASREPPQAPYEALRRLSAQEALARVDASLVRQQAILGAILDRMEHRERVRRGEDGFDG